MHNIIEDTRPMNPESIGFANKTKLSFRKENRWQQIDSKARRLRMI